MFTRIMLTLALVTSLVVAPAHTALAEECANAECITVTADDESDEIVVSIQRDSTRKTRTRSVQPPTVSGSFSAIADPARTWIPYHPDLYAAWREAARKAAATRAREASRARPVRSNEVVTASLSDRVRQLIPFGSIQTQPSQAAVVGRPVYFWSPTPTSFNVVLRISGVPVRLELTPSFEWSYGNGTATTPTTTRTTALPGAPYPAPVNIFTYHDPGLKQLMLTTTWSGEFTVAGVKAPINGKITQESRKVLDVREAPHRSIE